MKRNIRTVVIALSIAALSLSTIGSSVASAGGIRQQIFYVVRSTK